MLLLRLLDVLLMNWCFGYHVLVNYDENWRVVEGFVKMFNLLNCVGMVFDFMFVWVFANLLSTYTCKQPLGINLDVGGSKFGFLGEKWCETRNYRGISLRNSLIAKLPGAFSLIAKISLIAKLPSDSFLCFAFLCLFLSFLFWSGLWCKHESCR
jgi:hypothetical protein